MLSRAIRATWRRLFGSRASETWCLVGNVGGVRSDAAPSDGGAGTRHFSLGTKVYCLPPIWGDGYERIVAIGRHRGSRRFVSLIMASDDITNWRSKAVHDPQVLRMLEEGWDGRPVRWESRAAVDRAAAALLDHERRNPRARRPYSPRGVPHLEADIVFLPTSEGGRKTPSRSGYRPNHAFGRSALDDADHEYVGRDHADPGETVRTLLRLHHPPSNAGRLHVGMEFTVQEGPHVVGRGVIVAIHDDALRAEASR